MTIALLTVVALAHGGLIGYFGAWWVIGHEPLLKRNCHCGERR